MKACILYANEDLRWADMPTPKVENDLVLVRVRAAGICGSDVPRVLNHGAHFYPIVLGHEFSGEVEAVGEKVKGLKKGDRVAGIPLSPCHECIDCKNGDYSLCKNYTFFGSRVQGAFAEYIAMPERNLIRFDSSVSFETAAFFEPSTVALHGLFCAGFKAGADVAVLGGGTIGLFVAQWSRILGAKSVTVFDINDERLNLAKRLGVDYTINTATDDTTKRVSSITNGRGFRYVIESAGVSATMKLSFVVAGNKSDICFVGTPTSDLSFTPREFENMNRKEFRLTGSWMSYSAPFPGKEWTMTAEYFSNGQLKIVDDFIFKRYQMSKACEAFNLFKNPKEVKGKVLLINE